MITENGVSVLFNYGVAGVIIAWFMWRDSQRTRALVDAVSGLEKAIERMCARLDVLEASDRDWETP